MSSLSNMERVTGPSVVRNGEPPVRIELNNEYRARVKQRLGEMEFPEVTAAYQKVRTTPARRSGRKTGPGFSKRLVSMIYVGILCRGSLR